MDTMINKIETSGNYKVIDMTTGKKSAFVMINLKDGQVNVICKNASHAAWKGCGRYFNSINDAISGYKSTAMKIMIELAGTL